MNSRRSTLKPGRIILSWLMQQIVFQSLAEAARKGEAVALGIITGVKGSSPQKIGAKALFYKDGRIKGTLGGGCLEAEIQQRAIQSLRTGEASSFDLLLDHDFGWDDGLICGGKVFGLILPNAQGMGEGFWAELVERQATLGWGVRGDFSITASAEAEKPLKRLGSQSSPSTTRLKPDVNDWLYQETVTPP